MVNNVGETLTERHKTHGSYENQAGTSQILKAFCKSCPNWDKLNHAQLESLELILMKISRIMHGDHNHADTWHDIAGYATLAEKSIGIAPIIKTVRAPDLNKHLCKTVASCSCD